MGYVFPRDAFPRAYSQMKKAYSTTVILNKSVVKALASLARPTAARRRGLKSLWATSGVSRTPHAAIARVAHTASARTCGCLRN